MTQQLKIFSQIQDISVTDNSTKDSEINPALGFVNIIADYNTEREKNCEMSFDSNQSFIESDNPENAISVVVKPNMNGENKIGGFGSKSLNLSLARLGMVTAGESPSVYDFQNGAEFYLKELQNGAVPSKDNIQSLLSNFGDEQENLLGKSSHMVFDYFPGTSEYSQQFKADFCIVGCRNDLLRISFQSGYGVVCEMYDFQNHSWTYLSNVTTSDISNYTSLLEDTSDYFSATRTFDYSPSAVYDESSDIVYLCFSRFSFEKNTLVHEIHRSADEGKSWGKISEADSGFSFNPDIDVNVEVGQPYLLSNGILFRTISRNFETDITVKFEDTATAGSETATVSMSTNILIGIEDGVSTAYQVLQAILSSSSVMALVSPALAAGGNSRCFVTDTLEFEQFATLEVEGASVQGTYITSRTITGYSSLQNRTRLCIGAGRAVIVSAIAYQYTTSMITNNGGDSALTTTEEYHSMTWRVSTDGLRTWDSLETSRLDTPAAPLSRAIQDGLRAGLGSTGRNRINLFDYFSPGTASASYFEAMQNSWNFNTTPSFNSDIVDINYNTAFALYFDDIMQEFVIVKRADGLSTNVSYLMFLKSVGYQVYRWEPLVVLDLKGSQIEASNNTDIYEVMDVEAQSFENDLNFLSVKVKNLDDDSIYCVVTPFKFLAKIANSYDSATDSIYASIQNNPYFVRRGSQYDLLINKFSIPDTTIVPNYYMNASLYSADSDRYEISNVSTTKYQDCLVFAYYPVQFDLDNDIHGIAISRSWKNWYEERPYRISLVPQLYSNASDKTPDTLFWELELGANGGISAPSVEAGGAYWRFSGAESSINNGYNYYKDTAGTGQFFGNMNCKIRTRIRFVPPETAYTTLKFGLFDIWFADADYGYSQRIVVNLNYSSITGITQLQFLDGTIGPGVSLKGSITLTDVTPDYFFDLVLFFDTSNENTAKVRAKWKIADVEYNRPYSYDDTSFSLNSNSTLARGKIRWGIYEFQDIEAGLNDAVFYVDFAYFCYSDFYGYGDDKFPSDKFLLKSEEGFASEDFTTLNKQYAFGRKASSDGVESFYGTVRLYGETNNANVFYYGHLQRAEDMYNLVSNYSDIKLPLPLVITGESDYTFKMRFDSVRKEFFNKIIFVKSYLQPLTINFYNDASDTTIRDTIESNHYTIYNVRNEDGYIEITDELTDSLQNLINPSDYFGITNTGDYFEIDSVFDNFLIATLMTNEGNQLFIQQQGNISGATSIILIKKNFIVDCPTHPSQPAYYSFEVVMPQTGIDPSVLAFFETGSLQVPYCVGLIGLCFEESISNYVFNFSVSSQDIENVSANMTGNIIGLGEVETKNFYDISFLNLSNKHNLQFQKFVSMLRQMFLKDKLFLLYEDNELETIVAVSPQLDINRSISNNTSDGSISIKFTER